MILDKMLNLVNNVAESDAEYLHKSEARDAVRSASSEHRRMDLYISQSGNLTAIGYVNGNLVWFSITKVNDLFLTRRVFDCMKVGSFYRRVSLMTILDSVSVTMKDLESMCYVNAEHIEKDHPIFSGCLVSQPEQEGKEPLTGTEFAKIIAVLPLRLQSAIPNIGTEDDILTELEKDYATLESLYSKSESYNPQKQQKALSICRKWRTAECLKLSERAAIRTIYHDVCYHRYANESSG